MEQHVAVKMTFQGHSRSCDVT